MHRRKAHFRSGSPPRVAEIPRVAVTQVPRIAVGSIQPGVDTQAVVWAMLESFRRTGVQAQNFHCRSHFLKCDGALSITGLSTRHLDSWLMPPDLCRQLFCRASRGIDLAVIQGSFCPADPLGGDLEPLCRWLDLPRLVVLDVSQLEACSRSAFSFSADGVLVDGVRDARHLKRIATDMEMLRGIPVLGALPHVPDLHKALRRIPWGEGLPQELSRRLGDHFTRWWKPEEILRLASRGEVPRPSSCPGCCQPGGTKLTVAIAYDEAFNCYFPDFLDLLELRGATIVDFSPLHDEHLPPQTDIVYFGCGHPERYAAALADNHCMFASLRSHLYAGRRIYGEGGGAAYLCREMETPSGEVRRMAGILPAAAHWIAEPTPTAPAEVTLMRANWLGGAGTRLRGYQSSNWKFSAGDKDKNAGRPRIGSGELLGSYAAVGSPIHVNFAAHPECLQHFFRPELAMASLDQALAIGVFEE